MTECDSDDSISIQDAPHRRHKLNKSTTGARIAIRA